VVTTIRPLSGQPPASLSAARGLATLKVHLVYFIFTITTDSGNSYLGVKRFRELVDKNKNTGQMQAFAVLSQTDLRDLDSKHLQR
jgi:hypothetical protein